MARKTTSLGLILLLIMVLGRCQAQGTAKNIVYSKELKRAEGANKASRYAVSIQQDEAVKKAEAAFDQYLNIKTIDKSLVLEAALIEDDRLQLMNPYWKLGWHGKDAKKPIYTAEISAQTGKVLHLRYRPKWFHKILSREEALANQNKALTFIDKFALAGRAPVSIFAAASSYFEGIYLDFRYKTDKFIKIYFNESGDITGFRLWQQPEYSWQGNEFRMDRAEAIKMAQVIIKQYYDEVDTSKLIDDILLVKGYQGERTWFVYWENIAMLEGRDIVYGVQIDALTGKIIAIEGRNSPYYETAPKISKEKQREIADRFIKQKNLTDYRFEAFDNDLGGLRYRDQNGSPLLVCLHGGDIVFLSFFEMK